MALGGAVSPSRRLFFRTCRGSARPLVLGLQGFDRTSKLVSVCSIQPMPATVKQSLGTLNTVPYNYT